jgi:hypothetical protein
MLANAGFPPAGLAEVAPDLGAGAGGQGDCAPRPHPHRRQRETGIDAVC